MNQNKIPTTKLKRLGVIGSAGIKAGFKHTKYKTKSLLINKDKLEVEKSKHEEEMGELLFQTLTQLRGTALKAAQTICNETGVLPNSMLEKLNKSCYEVPPLNRAVVRKVIINEFGKPPEDIFSEFEPDAFAAASMGQVHNAITKEGDRVAVKIQYPGIDKTIQSDMNLLKKLFPKSLLNKLDLNYQSTIDTFDEIEERFIDETDFNLEAENLKWFKDNLKMDSIIIPKVYSNYSGRKILTTEKLDGIHLKELLLTNPSQKIKNQYAQTLYDLYIHTSRDLLKIHGDPNPGNFLFLPNDKIGLIDFGCTKQLTQEFVNRQVKRSQLLTEGKYQESWDILVELGIADEGTYSDKFLIIGDLFSLMIEKNIFDFKEHPNFVSEYVKAATGNDNVNNTPHEVVIYMRTQFGIMKICEQLGAEVEIRKYWI